MYTSFLFFALLFFGAFLLLSSTLRLFLKTKAEKKIDKAEKKIDNLIKNLKKKEIPIPLALIILLLTLILITAFFLADFSGTPDSHRAPPVQKYKY